MCHLDQPVRKNSVWLGFWMVSGPRWLMYDFSSWWVEKREKKGIQSSEMMQVLYTSRALAGYERGSTEGDQEDDEEGTGEEEGAVGVGLTLRHWFPGIAPADFGVSFAALSCSLRPFLVSIFMEIRQGVRG